MVVIGASLEGCLAAIEHGRRGHKVLVIEKGLWWLGPGETASNVASFVGPRSAVQPSETIARAEHWVADSGTQTERRAVSHRDLFEWRRVGGAWIVSACGVGGRALLWPIAWRPPTQCSVKSLGQDGSHSLGISELAVESGPQRSPPAHRCCRGRLVDARGTARECCGFANPAEQMVRALHLPREEAAFVRCLGIVTEVSRDGSRYRVLFRSRTNGRDMVVSGKHVIIAAGSVGSAGILLGLARSVPGLVSGTTGRDVSVVGEAVGRLECPPGEGIGRPVPRGATHSRVAAGDPAALRSQVNEVFDDAPAPGVRLQTAHGDEEGQAALIRLTTRQICPSDLSIEVENNVVRVATAASDVANELARAQQVLSLVERGVGGKYQRWDPWRPGTSPLDGLFAGRLVGGCKTGVDGRVATVDGVGRVFDTRLGIAAVHPGLYVLGQATEQPQRNGADRRTKVSTRSAVRHSMDALRARRRSGVGR